MKEYRLKGIFVEKNKIYTKNLTPGISVYGEKLVKRDGIEYREWNPQRSKLGSAVKKNISQIGIKEGTYVLYLGASSGTTASHVSDTVGNDGFVIALDFAPRMTRDLLFLARQRKNMAPLLGDAFKVETYKDKICEVDTVFQDIAQRNQVEIFCRNVDHFLKKGGFGLIAIKARSIDVTKNPKSIFKEVRRDLERKYSIVDYKELDPFEKDHALFVIKKHK